MKLRVVAAIAAFTACRAAAPPPVAAVARTPIALAAPAASDPVVGAVERGDALFVFTRDRVAIQRGSAPAVTAPAPAGGWAEAVAIPALDDAGDWVVARTGGGELWRVTATADLEPIQDRLGVPAPARAIAGGGTVAIALDDGVAVVRDRRHLERFSLDTRDGSAAAKAATTAQAAHAPLPPPPALAAGRDRIALRRGDAIEVWRLTDQRRVRYRVPGAIAAAFLAVAAQAGGAAGDRLIIATPGALYVEAGEQLRRVAAPAEIRGIAPAGNRLWLATAAGVYRFDGSGFLATLVRPAAADHLFGLVGGDVVVAGGDGVTRLSLAPDGGDPRWLATVEPIVQRVCGRCHDPGGTAGVDLSTVAAWRADRTELIRRVVETRTMPPAGSELGASDRDALARWLLDRRP